LSADELEIIKGKARAQSEAALYNFGVIEHFAEAKKEYQTTLRRFSGRDAGESMVIQVDEKIIPNHNDIFTTPIVDFIVRVLNCGYAEQLCRSTLKNLDVIDLPAGDGLKE
jgi:hypothetical protein